MVECSHSKREALGSSPGPATIFSSRDIWWLTLGSWLGQRGSKGACLLVPPLFRADSGINLIKQGENVKGRPCDSVAQLAECLHGKREALGSSPGPATIFSSRDTEKLYNKQTISCNARARACWTCSKGLFGFFSLSHIYSFFLSLGDSSKQTEILSKEQLTTKENSYSPLSLINIKKKVHFFFTIF